MPVLVRPRKPSGIGSFLGGIGKVMSFIPGMNMVGAGLSTAGSLMNGDVGGAAGAAGELFGGQEDPNINQGSTDTWQDQWNKQQEMNTESEYGMGPLLYKQWMNGGR